MSRGVLILIVVVVAGALYAMSVQRTAVGKDESVIEKWANVEAAYQRRADLIPNLQSIVKGAADLGCKIHHEDELVTHDGRVGREVGIVDFDGNLVVIYNIPEK